MKEVIHFVHGNGFPSPCYRQLLKHFEPRFDCFYLDRVGHSTDFPVTENWHYLVDEVIASIQTQCAKPVIAIGHSLGGVLSLIAAVHRPDLFKTIVLLDSPLLGPLKSIVIRLSKAIGMIDTLTPALQTKYRRQHWMTREQAVNYLRGRALFKSFDESCLQDYIDYGMVKDEHGFSLRFERKIEYEIYRTIPHICYQYEGKLQIPTVLIYGDNSHLIQASELRYMKRKYNINAVKTHGSHMFPLEYPDATAAMVLEVINQFNKSG